MGYRVSSESHIWNRIQRGIITFPGLNEIQDAVSCMTSPCCDLILTEPKDQLEYLSHWTTPTMQVFFLQTTMQSII